jgi:16S rRNA (guanine(966)-N(2))-methyltransferase RsmD
MPRVISGSARGRKLFTVKGDNTRPTADRVKETLFNVLSFDISGCSFLDLYCGTGAIGVEALSRGASFAVFVDNNNEAIAVTRRNLEAAKFEVGKREFGAKARLVLEDVGSGIKRLASEGWRFDTIFLDPPYAVEIALAIELCLCYNLLNDHGLIVAEVAASSPAPEFEGLSLHKIKPFNTAKLLFYRFTEN